MQLSIIVPVFNEKNTIEEVIKRVSSVAYEKEIIIVDDGSTDGTKTCLEEIKKRASQDGHGNLKIIFHEKNMGKGAAIRTGLKYATGDIIIIQDADLEYDPKDYPVLLEPILEDKADVVYGSRFLGGPHRVLYFWHYVGNKIITLLSNMFTDLNLTDMETGYKVFRRDAIKDIEIKSNRFGFEPEITAKVAKKGLRVYEVPISYYGRSYEDGKKITWKDGVKAVFTILKYNLFSK
ncbi:MAG: glycosyltransferase family 2 protein [Syntrophorhabdaceae bacterium]|nr:glycosyltransferase family 2 protein [Syntrophorhabdaceae bacterium]